MGLLIVVLIVGGVYCLIKFTDCIKYFLPPNEQAVYSSRTAEQKRVIRYFYLTGIFAIGEMSDMEYDSMLKNYLDNTNFKKKALDKFEVDEDELKEVEPFKLEAYFFDKDKTLWKKCNDGKTRSSAWQVSWLFATSDKFFVYSNVIYLDRDTKKITAEDYFWKDITKFSTSCETEEIAKVVSNMKNGQPIMKTATVEANVFSIVVPGAKVECLMDGSDATELSIKPLRTKLDEKKKGL
jgi:hypothetical protein